MFFIFVFGKIFYALFFCLYEDIHALFSMAKAEFLFMFLLISSIVQVPKTFSYFCASLWHK